MLTHAEVRQEVRQQLITACKRYAGMPVQCNRPSVLTAMGAMSVLNTTDTHTHWKEYADHLANFDSSDWPMQLTTVSEWSKT